MVDSASADRQLTPRRLREAYAAFTRLLCGRRAEPCAAKLIALPADRRLTPFTHADYVHVVNLSYVPRTAPLDAGRSASKTDKRMSLPRCTDWGKN